MFSWFCGDLCIAENEDKNQIIMMNNKTEQVFKYGNALKTTNLLRQLDQNIGFIMVKKSDYDQKLQNCIRKKKPFTDEQFKPNSKSIYDQNQTQFIQLKNKSITWKRIPEIYQNCQLIKGKIEPSDIQQGNVGDCYFLSAISALAQNQNNILKIFGKKDVKSMVKNQYGIYKLVVNVAGQPQQVIVDDFVPVYEKSLRPVFCKPVNNEFWVVLLQKAWAKINKSYQNIAYGNSHEVFNRFSVAPVFYHNIPANFYPQGRRIESKQVLSFENNLWQKLTEGHKQNFPMCCGSRQKINDEGIRPLHAYTLLAVYEIPVKGQNIRLLKLRNPWGNFEYSGSFSENDPIWNQIDSKIKSQILEKRQNDGIFIIPYNEFLLNFESVDISHSKNEYNYIFKSVKFAEGDKAYFKLAVEQEGEVYLTFEKNYTRNSKLAQYQGNGVSKIFIAEELESGQIEFVDCALETTLADVTIRCRKLRPGVYLIMVQNEDLKQENETNGFYGKNLKKGTVSAYSSVPCFIQQISEVKNFNSQFFTTHALKYNRERKPLSHLPNDWITKSLIQQSGYGYICMSLDEKGSKQYLVTLNLKKIQEEGFRVQISQETMQKVRGVTSEIFEIQICPGENAIFMFKIDFKRESLRLSFPPQGFDIKKII